MAVTAWTQKQVVDLFPKWLDKRLSGHRARAEALAAEAGVRVPVLSLLVNQPSVWEDGVVTLARHRWRSPYTLKDPWTASWNDLVAAGLAETVSGGWRVTLLGRGLIDRATRDVRAYLERLALPPLELRRVTAVVLGLRDGIPASAERTRAARRGLPLPEDARSDVVRADVGIRELWLFRDDCHVAAWQSAAYGGPFLDVLSQVWEGRTAFDDVVTALAAKQERADVAACVHRLVERGDLTSDGETLALTPQGKAQRDGIEADTDRRYFSSWPKGDPLARFGEDLSALLAALP